MLGIVEFCEFVVSSGPLYTLLITTAVLFAIHKWQQSTHMFVLGNKIPGPKPLPFIGNCLEILSIYGAEGVVVRALELAEQYGNTIRGWLGPKLVIFLMDPDDVELILGSNSHLEKATEYRFFKPWLGDGLLISSGEKWRSHRKMIAPTFHMNILKSFMDVFNRNSVETVKKLQKEVGRTFDVHDYMSTTTVNILLETAMGITRKNQDESGFDYAMAVMKMCDILHQRHYKPWFRFDTIFNFTSLAKQQEKLLGIIHGLTNKVIKQKKEDFDNHKVDNMTLFEQLTKEVEENENRELNGKAENKTTFTGLRDDLDDIDENDVGEKKRLAFLDFMIESQKEGNNLSDRDIKEEVDTIMFEGHDTTAAGSSFVLCLLGVHQRIQDKVYQELQDIFGSSNRPATYNDILEMKYLERVILETLRLYPPVPAIARVLKEDVKLASGDYTAPAGSTIVIGTFKIHRNPKYYPNPEVFNPDNFLPERCQQRHYYSFIPFSAGPRSCVGRKYAMLKLKVLLSTILRNFHVVCHHTERDFRLQADIILKRADGFRIELKPRIKSQ